MEDILCVLLDRFCLCYVCSFVCLSSSLSLSSTSAAMFLWSGLPYHSSIHVTAVFLGSVRTMVSQNDQVITRAKDVVPTTHLHRHEFTWHTDYIAR